MIADDQSHVTNCLAQFVARSQWEAIPPEVRREGVRGLLNFGCAVSGARDDAMDIAVKTPFFGPPQAIVIGRGERPDALNAAVLNVISSDTLFRRPPDTTFLYPHPQATARTVKKFATPGRPRPPV